MATENYLCRLCTEARWATWQIGTQCSCTVVLNVCAKHVTRGMRQVGERNDSHQDKEMVTARPLPKR